MAKKKTEAINENTDLVMHEQERPSYITVAENGEGAGLEDVRAQDILVARTKLLQGLSPEVDEGTNTAGQILDSITKEVLADREETLRFIPVFHYLQWIEWADREDGGGILNQSVDPKGDLAMSVARKETRVNSKGKTVFRVTEYHNFLVLFPEISMKFPRVIACAKTNHRQGRQLLALCRMREGCPIYSGAYTLASKKAENRDGDKYYTFGFENAGWASENEFKVTEVAHAFYKNAHEQQRLAVQQEDEAAAAETEI